jgi:long-chain fatty acid transport protein
LGTQLATQFAGNPNYDGRVEVNGDDWGYGYNFGMMFDIDKGTRVGLAYRSKISQRLSGTANWTVANTFTNDPYLAAAGAALGVPNLGATVQGTLNSEFTNGGAQIAVDTPESYSLSFYKEVNDRLALMADVTHTRHSRLKAITIQFANGLPNANIPENWTDTTKVSIGGSYKYSDTVKLRAGFMHDASPVSDTNRTPALPDGDRKWYSVGANWMLSKANSLDFAYSFVQVGNEQVNNYDNGGLAGGVCDSTKNTSSCATTIAKQNVYSHIVALQYNHRF